MASKKQKPLIRHLLNTLIFIIIFSVGYFCFVIVYDLRIRFNNRSELNDIARVNEKYAETFQSFIDDIERETDWKVKVISGLRTKEEQIELKRNNPKNASSGKSRHVLGRAVDLNLYKRSWFSVLWLKKANSNSSWRRTGVPDIAKRYQLFWGGNYRSYHDPVHFEIN